MMKWVATMVAVAAIVALPGARANGVCGRVIGANNNEEEANCISTGCRWVNNACRQPTSCTAADNDYFTFSHPTIDNGARKNTGMQVKRHPVSPEVARLCDTDSECSAVYVAHLDYKFVTGGPNCNDLGMLPPHGVDQAECVGTDTVYSASDLKDWRGYPYKDNGARQSLAAAANSVTALTESGTDCHSSGGTGSNLNCAFPRGFKSDTIRKGTGICVEVRNVRDRWVEIKAATRDDSAGGSYCVRDRNALIDAEMGCTNMGDLDQVMASGNSVGTDNMNLIFYVTDNTDDANLNLHWRIAASHMVSTDPSGSEKEAEDWSMHRNANDFPSALMSPYPDNYDAPPVFESTAGGGAAWVAPGAALVSALVMMAMALLLA